MKIAIDNDKVYFTHEGIQMSIENFMLAFDLNVYNTMEYDPEKNETEHIPKFTRKYTLGYGNFKDFSKVLETIIKEWK